MTDLVQRLRTFAIWSDPQILCDAANRIERLERELAEANKPPTGTAPCTRYCEHTAFVIEARQHKTLIARLERENAELRKDAERYQWLASDPYHDGYAWWTQDTCVLESMDSSSKPTKTQVDAAIDEAMKS